jgi:hypothetical protein
LTLIDSALGGHDIEENKTPKTPDRNEQAKKKRKQSSEAPNPTVNGMKIFNANFLNSEKAAVLLAQKNSKISMLSLKVSVGVISNAQLCDEIEQIQTEYDNLLRENDIKYPIMEAIDLTGEEDQPTPSPVQVKLSSSNRSPKRRMFDLDSTSVTLALNELEAISDEPDDELDSDD